MDAELTALAAAGATALVQQMVTDGWVNVRDRVVAFFSRGSEEEVIEGELEESRAELAAAWAAEDEEAAADVQASWRSRLRRTLRDNPEAVAELRALLDELAPQSAASQHSTVHNIHNTINGGVHHGTVIQAGTIGEPPRRRP
ncbi:hypothetical protein GCM10023080_025290 [Streptomyces pseudoechinosporeus]